MNSSEIQSSANISYKFNRGKTVHKYASHNFYREHRLQVPTTSKRLKTVFAVLGVLS
jgi:hypothetical protein